MKTPIALAFLLLAAASQAQVTKQAGGYLLRVKYTPGQTMKYTTVNSMAGLQQGAQPTKITMPVIMKVGKVEKNYTNLTVTAGPVTLGGNELMKKQTLDMQVDTMNRGRSKKGSNLTGAQLPQKPLKIGETWTTTAPIPDTSGMSNTMQALYKFNGLKTINGKNLAVITYTLKGGVTGSGTLYLLAADGTIHSNEAKINYNGPTGALKVTSLMKRV